MVDNIIKKIEISFKEVFNSGIFFFKQISINKNFNEVQSYLINLLEKIYYAGNNSFNLMNQINVFKKDFIKLKQKINNFNNKDSKLELIMDFINNRPYIIRLLYSLKKDENNKSYIERYLDTLNFIKNTCDQHQQKALKKKILEKEAKFIKNNKEKLRKLYEKKLII